MQVSLLGFRSIFSQEIDFEDLGEEDFAPAPPSSRIHDPAPQVPHNNLDDPPNHPALDLYLATFVVLLLGLQALDTEIRIVRVSLMSLYKVEELSGVNSSSFPVSSFSSSSRTLQVCLEVEPDCHPAFKLM